MVEVGRGGGGEGDREDGGERGLPCLLISMVMVTGTYRMVGQGIFERELEKSVTVGVPLAGGTKALDPFSLLFLTSKNINV